MPMDGSYVDTSGLGRGGRAIRREHRLVNGASGHTCGG